ncbi:MAG: hypothetical protein Kow00129_08540 [Thermoleophilia bacterium]
MTEWTVASLLQVATRYLAAKVPDSPRLDAELLLAEALGLERVQLYVQHDRPLSVEEVSAFRKLTARRAKGEPIAYILGRASFRYLDLFVSRPVLIPRPETEELVEAALEELRLRPPFLPDGVSDAWGSPVVADVGTGSGAIALSLAFEAGIKVTAVDSSPEALEVARRNSELLGAEAAATMKQGDLLEGIPPGRLRLIVSNPPYVTDSEYEQLDRQVREFEPAAALRAGPEGLDVLSRLIPAAARVLSPGGTLLLEVGHTQAGLVADLARSAGFAFVQIRHDLSGKERVVRAVRPGALLRTADDLTPWETGALKAALAEGAVIGLPTDTVYGLAARWDSGAGVRAVFTAKGREPDRPVAALFPSAASVRHHLTDLDDTTIRVLERLLPGPYTFVVATRVPRPPLVGTEDSLGVRVPDHPALLSLLGRLEMPVAATSANFSGRPDVAAVEEADPALLAHCAVAFRGRGGGEASTVVDLRPLVAGGAPVVLREGAVSEAEMRSRVAAALE